MIELVHNLSLLVVTGHIAGLLAGRNWHRPLLRRLLIGGLFGGTAVLGMFFPMHLVPGLFFDGRSMLLALCGYYFGPLPVAVAALACTITRLLQGGIGTGVGVGVIIASSVLGLLFARGRHRANPFLRLVLLSLATHVAMLALMLPIPDGSGWQVVERIAFPVLAYFPAATVILGRLLEMQERRRIADQNLAESEARYRLLAENTPDMIFLLGPAGEVLYVNPVAAAAVGIEPGKPRDVNQATLFPPGLAERHRALIRQVFETGQPFLDNEPEYLAASGRWIMVRLVPIPGEEGKTIAVLGIAHDVTESREQQARIRLHSLVLEQISDQIVLTDLEGTITYANPAQLAFLGYREDGLIGQKISIFGEDPNEGASQAEILERTLCDGSWRGTVVNYAADGTRYQLDCRTQVVRDAEGRPTALCGISTDITRRKLVEENLITRLRYEEGLVACSAALSSNLETTAPALRHLLEAAQVDRVYIFRNSVDGTGQLCMSQIEEVVAAGIPGELDNPGLQMLPYKNAYPELQATLEAGKPFHGEVHTMPPATRAILEEQGIRSILILPLFAGNHWFGLIGFDSVRETREWRAEDISLLGTAARLVGNYYEQRASEKRLRHEQKLAALGTLAGGVAHEINNPLMSIINFAQLSLDRMPPAAAEAAEWQNLIIAEGQRIAAIVRNLLAFSRRDSGERSMTPVTELIDGATSLLSGLLAKQEISLACSLPESPPAVLCEPSQIRQVLLNLITNARDALLGRPKGAYPDMRISIDVEYPVEEPGRLRILVGDNGPGVPPEIASYIFDPFFTTKPGESGTGLGLSISHGLIAEHGGKLSFRSEPGEGAVFIIELPAATDDADHDGD